MHLQNTAVNNGRVTLGSTGLRSDGLNGADNSVGFDISICNLAEDDVLSVEPAGHNCGDEELRTVGVWSSVGHGQ